jgi:hypothetical protein
MLTVSRAASDLLAPGCVVRKGLARRERRRLAADGRVPCSCRFPLAPAGLTASGALVQFGSVIVVIVCTDQQVQALAQQHRDRIRGRDGIGQTGLELPEHTAVAC